MSSPSYHLAVVAFDFRDMAALALERTQDAVRDHAFTLTDWAVISKEVGGKTEISSSRRADPGAARGGAFGGGAGLVLAVLSGPIGAGAVLGGAAIGAVTAGLLDSGFPQARLKEISTLMRDGRTLLLLAVPIDDVPKLDALIEGATAFNAVAGRYDVDITPANTLSDALDQYRATEEPGAA